jgi:hypothetical protein
MSKLKSFWIISILAMSVNITAVNGAPPEIALTLPTEYQFAGYTEATTSGNAGGVFGMHALCQQEFGPEARMCTTKEWWESSNNGPPPMEPPKSAWVHSTVITSNITSTGALVLMDITNTGIYVSDPLFPQERLTCDHWTSEGNNRQGTILKLLDDVQQIFQQDCITMNRVTCCTPASITRQ